MADKFTTYLQSGRLGDVLALIQLLAFDKHGYRTETGITRKLGRSPLSAESWLQIAKAHPEFFRVRSKESDPDRTERAALIIRYIVGKVEDEDGDKSRPPLSTELGANLFRIAIDLHDKQVARSKEWQPYIIAILGAVVAIAVALLKN
jgi:hypothetical protein